MMKIPKFYAVLGKWDFLNWQGKRRGLWEFLAEDKQPFGWLISLTKKPPLLPPSPILWDCGAFSYSHCQYPMIGKQLVTPLWAISQYRIKAHSGDIITCPDHILLPGTNLEQRREFNQKSALAFLKLAKLYLPDCLPLATIHGITIQEKVASAQWLYHLGYQHLAIGGLAHNASQKKRNFSLIKAITNSLPKDCLIHVFGLCSPHYVSHFQEMGINSFDGSSWLRDSLFNLFYTSKLSQIDKLYCPRSINELASITECNCLTCRLLKQAQIEVRIQGNRQVMLGRAAHNLGQLIQAYNSPPLSQDQQLSLL